jgi:glycosyltransferase involved in cell wall biosynthesis
VLMIISGLRLGGAEGQLLKLSQNMDATRFSTAVISLTDCGILGAEFRDRGIPVDELGIPYKLGGLTRLLSICRRFQPHVIHGWMYHGNIAASLAKFASRTPRPAVVHSVRASPLKSGETKRLTQLALRLGAPLSYRASCVLYNASSSAYAHEQEYGYCASRRHIIPNGIDTQAFCPSASARLSIRQDIRVSSSTRLIGMIGRYDPMNDHRTFCAAAAQLLPAFEDVHFLLAGTDISWDNQHLARLAQEFLPREKVHLLGARRDRPRLMAALDVLASSSAYGEASPNVIAEAMSCGIVCVATSVGDAAALIGDCGYVVPAREPGQLSAALARALLLGQDEKERLGSAARNRIAESYSLATCVRRHCDLYTHLAAGVQH